MSATLAEGRLLAALARRVPRGVRPGLRTLHDANRALWDLEDRVRSRRSAAAIGHLKRRIDPLNLARHAAVAAIDARLARRPGGEVDDPRAYLSSESIGQMLDRGSILCLKLVVLGEGARRALAAKRWEHLIASLERALAALRAGRFVHPPVGEVKLYGEGRAPTRRRG